MHHSALMSLDASGEDAAPSPVGSPVVAKTQPVVNAVDPSEGEALESKVAEEAGKEADEVVEEKPADEDKA